MDTYLIDSHGNPGASSSASLTAPIYSRASNRSTGSEIHDSIAHIAQDVQNLVAGQRRLEIKLAQVAQDQSDSKDAFVSISAGLERASLGEPPALHIDTGNLRPPEAPSIVSTINDAGHRDLDIADQAQALLVDMGMPESPQESFEPCAGRKKRNDGTGKASSASIGASASAASFHLPSRVSLRSDVTQDKSKVSSLITGLPESWPSCIEKRYFKECKLLVDSEDLTLIEENMHEICHASSRRATHRVGGVSSRRGSRYVLGPTSTIRLCFDVLSLIVLAYDLTSMPYCLAWEKPFFKPASYAILLFWTMDIVLSFRTGFYAEGVLVKESWKIALRYLKTSFLLDIMLVSVDAVTLVFDSINADGADGSVDGAKAARVLKISRYARVIRILRMCHGLDAFERLSDRFSWARSSHSENAVYVVKVLLFILWINHFQSCAWYALGRATGADTGTSWLDTSISEWKSDTYRESGEVYQYFTSMHWALTQMTPGSMQVFPMNSSERALNIACLIFGLLFFSTMVSSVASKLTALRMQRLNQTMILSDLRRFLRESMISPALSVTAQKEATQRLKQQNQKKLRVMAVGALNLLTEVTCEELMLELCCPFFFRLPFFRLCAQVEQAVIRKLATEACAWLSLHTSGESLFRACKRATAAYVAVSGEMIYALDPLVPTTGDHTVKTVKVGVWVAEAALWCLWTHVGDLAANTESEVLKLDAEKFSRVMSEGKVVSEFVSAYTDLFHRCVLSARPPNAPWPDDLVVPYSEYDAIIASAPRHIQFATGYVTADILQSQAKTKGGRRNSLRPASFGPTTTNVAVKGLVSELRDGKSLIVVTDSGEVQRAAVVMVIRLEAPDGRLFARIGKYCAGAFEADCKLPGSKVRSGETFQTVLDGELAPLRHAVQVNSFETVHQWKVSDRYGIKTKYTKHVHLATLDEDFDMSQLPRARCAAPRASDAVAALDLRSCPYVQDTSGPRDIYAFASPTSVFLYTPLSTQELDDLSSPDNTAGLRDWLRDSVHEEHLRDLQAVHVSAPSDLNI